MMPESSKRPAPEAAAEPATPTKEPVVVGMGAEITSPMKWLERWQQIPKASEKDLTKEVVRAIILLRASVKKKPAPVTYDRDQCLYDLKLAGESVANGGPGDIASAIVETVRVRITEENEFHENRQRDLFSQRAVQMLFVGLVVQGGMLFALFRSLTLLTDELPLEVLGVKTLSILAVVVSGIAGSVARLVYESQSGVADKMTLSNFGSMAATSFARPLLAAVLALFVFALFQCGVLGIPFEKLPVERLPEATGAVVTAPSAAFTREDFFFVAIAFVIGFNDTVGLNVLAFVGRYLPQADTGIPTHPESDSSSKKPSSSTEDTASSTKVP